MKHKNLFLILIAVFALSAVMLFSGTGAVREVAFAATPVDYSSVTAAAVGTGTEDDPYVIDTSVDENVRGVAFLKFIDEQLDISNQNGVYFCVSSNVELAHISNYVPIGTGREYLFAGVLYSPEDAPAFSINGMSYASDAAVSDIGLFAKLGAALISNLNVSNSDVSAANGTNVGALAGSANGASIQKVSINSLTLTGHTNVGGVVGSATGGTVFELVTLNDGATLVGDTNVGGLVGYVTGGRVNKVRTSGTYTGAYKVGGLVGFAALSAADGSVFNLTQSYSIALIKKSISGFVTDYFGGLVGYYETNDSRSFRLSTCYFAGAFDATALSNYGGLLGINIRSTNPHTVNINATSCYYNIKCFAASTLTPRSFPNASTSLDTANFKPIEDSAASYMATYSGWDFDTVWVIDTTKSSGLGKYPDFIDHYTGTYKITIVSDGEQSNEELLEQVGFLSGTRFNVIAESSFTLKFSPPEGYYLESLLLHMGDSSEENSRNIVTGARANASFDAEANVLNVTSVTSEATLTFIIDSNDFKFIVKQRDYISEGSSDYRGSVTVMQAAGEVWNISTANPNVYHNSFKYDENFVLPFRSGQITLHTVGTDGIITDRTVRDIYKLAQVKVGGVLLNMSSILVSGSTELSGTLVFNIESISELAGLQYTKLYSSEYSATYLEIELVWVARECEVIENSPVLDGTVGATTGFGTVTITGNATPGVYLMGETLTITAEPTKDINGIPEYMFYEWRTNDSSGYATLENTPASFSVTLSPDISRIDITAKFRKLWNINFGVQGEGSVRITANFASLNIDTYITPTYKIENYQSVSSYAATLQTESERLAYIEAHKQYVNDEDHTQSGSIVVQLPNAVTVSYSLDYMLDTISSFSYGTYSSTFRYDSNYPALECKGTFVVGSSYSVVAVNYLPITYTISVSAKVSDHGTAYIVGSTTEFSKDEVAQVEVKANANYRFSHWETVPTSGEGEVYDSVSSGGNLFDEIITNTTTYTCRIRISNDISLRAVFVRCYSVTLSINQVGTGYGARIYTGSEFVTTQTQTVLAGDDVTFNVRIYEGYVLTGDKARDSVGTQDVNGVPTPYAGYIFVYENVTAKTVDTVNYSIVTYTLSVASANTAHGSASGSGLFAYKYNASISATPNSGYRFYGWMKDASPEYDLDGSLSASNVYWSRTPNATISMTASSNLVAVFVPEEEVADRQYTINVSAASSNVTVGLYSGNYSRGQSYTTSPSTSLRARANVAAGYSFVGWYLEGYDSVSAPVSTSIDYSFVPTEDLSLVAVCSQNIYKVTVLQSNCIIDVENKTYNIVGGNKEYSCTYKESLVFICTPNSGFELTGWVRNGLVYTMQTLRYPAEITDSITISTTMVSTVTSGTHDSTSTAKITITSNDSSMGSASGGGIVSVGTSKVIYASPRKGYTFIRWEDSEGNTVSTDATFTITSTVDVAYVAVFEIASNNIIKTAGQGGTIDGPDRIAYLEAAEYTITAERGFVIADLRINGEYIDVKDAETYTASIVGTGSDQTVTVRFERAGLTVTYIGLIGGGAGLLFIIGIVIVVAVRKKSAARQ